jgi:hypothetical protein
MCSGVLPPNNLRALILGGASGSDDGISDTALPGRRPRNSPVYIELPFLTAGHPLEAVPLQISSAASGKLLAQLLTLSAHHTGGEATTPDRESETLVLPLGDLASVLGHGVTGSNGRSVGEGNTGYIVDRILVAWPEGLIGAAIDPHEEDSAVRLSIHEPQLGDTVVSCGADYGGTDKIIWIAQVDVVSFGQGATVELPRDIG